MYMYILVLGLPSIWKLGYPTGIETGTRVPVQSTSICVATVHITHKHKLWEYIDSWLSRRTLLYLNTTQAATKLRTVTTVKQHGFIIYNYACYIKLIHAVDCLQARPLDPRGFSLIGNKQQARVTWLLKSVRYKKPLYFRYFTQNYKIIGAVWVLAVGYNFMEAELNTKKYKQA